VSGIGAGTLVMPPLAAWAIARSDWRTTYLLLALLTLLVGGVGALLIAHSPERRGLLPDGDAPGARAAAPAGARARDAAPQSDWTARSALRARPFRLLYLAATVLSIGTFVPLTHLVEFALDHGLAPETSALMLGLIGAGSTAARLALGGVADRFGRRRSLILAAAGMAIMLFWWLAATDVPRLAVFAVVFGLFYGTFVALLPALTTDYFGGRHAGAVIGLLYTSVGLASFVGPTLAGLVYDLVGSYAPVIVLTAVGDLVAAGCVVLMPEAQRWRAEQARAALAPRAGETARSAGSHPGTPRP